MIFDTISNNSIRKLHLLNVDKVYLIDNNIELKIFIDECTEISSLFSFISTIIIKKSYWDSIKILDSEKLDPYTHMLRIMRGITTINTKIKYLSNPLVITGKSINQYTKFNGMHFLLDYNTFEYLKSNIINDINIKKSLNELFHRQYTEKKYRSIKMRFNRREWKEYIKCFTNNKIDAYNDRYNIKDSILNIILKICNIFGILKIRKYLKEEYKLFR